MQYKVVRSKHCSFGCPPPLCGEHSYGICSNWVNAQVPAYSWQYNIIPV